MRAILRHLGVIGVFALPAVALFWHAWDGHLTTTATCACSDAGQQIWFTAWPAYALSHGLNPFFSSLVWAPKGTNLLVNASTPLIGLVLAPLTWAWGPIASTTLALTLAPAFSAWGCWIACRRFTSWRPAAWLGGFLFGYSPFVYSSIRQGHLALGFLVFPPLILVLMDEILAKQNWRFWKSGLALGLLVVGQFLVSAEVLIMVSSVTVVGLVPAAILAGPSWYRDRSLYAFEAAGVAVAVAAALLAFPAWFALDGPSHIVGAVWPGINLFGNHVNDLWDPDSIASAPSVANFGPMGHSLANLGFTGPNAAYVGFGVLIVAILSVIAAWRRKMTWVLLIAAMTSFVLSLGAAELRSDALASLSWLPWQSLVKWPLLDDVLPGRFALLTDLALSVLVAIGLDATRKRFTGSSRSSDEPMVLPDPDVQGGVTPWRRPVGLAGVMCVVAASSLVPIWRLYSIPTATEEVHVPPWFSTAALRLPTGSVVLTYPFPASASLSSEAMIWQAVDNMQFGLAGGYVKVPGPDGHPLAAGTPGSATSSLTLLTLVKQTPENAWSPSPAELAAIRSALSSWKVAFIVVTATGSNPVYTAAVMTAVSGRVPQVSHRAWVWNLHAAALATPFNAVAASSAFGACRLKPNMYQTLPASDPIPQGANMCVLDALDSRADP